MEFVGGTGACRIPGGGSCYLTTSDGCSAVGGNWSGRNVPCSLNPCLDRACCINDGECFLGPLWMCNEANGTWLGTPVCDPNPCATSDAEGGDAPPPQSSSWGRIKDKYR